jgi:hypothetical protein
MLHQRIRTFLVWLLVLAVPAQGLAAVTMAFCGPMHDRAGVSLSHQPGHQAHHEQAAGSSPAGHDHQAMLAVVQADGGTAHTADVADTAPTTAESPPQQGHKCSVCSTCCSVGALMNTVLAVPELAAAHTVFAAVVATVATAAVDGLERPPRAARA